MMKIPGEYTEELNQKQLIMGYIHKAKKWGMLVGCGQEKEYGY